MCKCGLVFHTNAKSARQYMPRSPLYIVQGYTLHPLRRFKRFALRANATALTCKAS